MTHNPLFSVITPSLNQGRYIEKMILSVLAQEGVSFEHFIIDGGSTDHTLDILRKYKHLRWIFEPDTGIPQALNKGFQMARGDIIAWINSDDYYAPDAFKKAVAFFTQNPEACVWVGRAAVVDERGKLLFYQEEPEPRGFTHEGMVRFWENCTLPQPSVFFRRSVLEKVGLMDETLRYYMDYDFFLRLSREYAFCRTDEVLSCIGLHWEASSVRDIAKGQLRKALFRISRRYWGPKLSFRYYGHLFSYLNAWPGLAWKTYYDQFAFAVKRELGWDKPRTFSWSLFRRICPFACRYPLPAAVAALKFIFRKARSTERVS